MLGTIDASVRARIPREPKVDFQKAIDMCRNSEITSLQLRNTSNEKKPTVNYMKNSGRKRK